MPSHPLPPIAQEAVLKLLAVGKSARRDGPRFDEALAARERPALRLEGAPLQPVWPMPAPGESARPTARRPARRLPPRRRPNPDMGFGPDREGDA